MTEKKASSKIKCVCGTPVKEGAKFCPNCGIKYFWGDEDDEVICRGCSKKISVSDNYCPYCGRRNNIDVSAIAQTSVNIADEGSPSRKMAVPREKSSSQKSSGGLIVGEILLILAAMIGIGAIALFLFNLTGGGKYPILIWIICGLVFLFFNGSVETALVVAAVLAVVGVLCRASYYSSNNR